MTNDEILKEILAAAKSTGERFDSLDKEIKSMKSDIQSMKGEISDIKASQVRMENDHGEKISALFDGYTLRGDQIERLQEHLDERFDAIQTDLSYVFSKVAQHDRNIIRLNRKAK